MIWTICFTISIAILLISIIVCVFKTFHIPEKSRRIRPFYHLAGGVFLSAVFLMLPFYVRQYTDTPSYVFRSVVSAIHHTIQLFTVDADRGILEGYAALSQEATPKGQESISLLFNAYTWMLSIEFILAPVLTFGFIISFFKNFMSNVHYCARFFCEKYIFSELNENSLALAKSIKRKKPRATIVFTDVFEKGEEASYELIDQAQRIHSICFKKDLLQVHFGFHFPRKKMHFFLIGEDETENLSQAISIIDRYDKPFVMLFLFSSRIESEYILNAKVKRISDTQSNASNHAGIQVRRINAVQSLIYQSLYEQVKDTTGKSQTENIFSKACELNPKNERGAVPISALILGMGQHGTEMVKALCWFCQMDGYELSIHAYDKDPQAKDKFILQCPDLMKQKPDQIPDADESYVNIKIHSGIDVQTQHFASMLKEVKDVTYVLICLGDDALNIQTALMLRTLFERMPEHQGDKQPIIQAIVYSSELLGTLDNMTDRSGNLYDIDFIGDVDHLFDEKVIINSELLDEALQVHKAWAESGTLDNPKKYEEKMQYFLKYEYHQRSSVTSAIHKLAREYCHVQTDNEEQRAAVEHRRWSAYMRGEGYVAGEGTAPRATLAKTHHDLKSYPKLDEKEKRKTENVSKPG